MSNIFFFLNLINQTYNKITKNLLTRFYLTNIHTIVLLLIKELWFMLEKNTEGGTREFVLLVIILEWKIFPISRNFSEVQTVVELDKLHDNAKVNTINICHDHVKFTGTVNYCFSPENIEWVV